MHGLFEFWIQHRIDADSSRIRCADVSHLYSHRLPTFETTILNHVAVSPEYESKFFSKTHYNRNLLGILQVSN